MDDGNPGGGFGNLIRKLFNRGENVTEEEIINLVSEGHEQGVLEASEMEMIHNIFEMDDKEVEDIMTHRKNIVAVDVNTDVESAAHFMLEEKFSRYPLYEGDIDNIIGILHLRDVMRVVMNKEDMRPVREIMRKPYYVPDTKGINSLFKEMQQKKMHMAVVVDEYGQTSGIVAMEDILEEIVGNILDEYDVDEDFINQVDPDTYIMKGMTPLSDIEDVLDIQFEEDDYGTLNGLLISELEHIPEDGETANVCLQGFKFQVLSVKDKMISEVRVTRESMDEMKETKE